MAQIITPQLYIYIYVYIYIYLSLSLSLAPPLSLSDLSFLWCVLIFVVFIRILFFLSVSVSLSLYLSFSLSLFLSFSLRLWLFLCECAHEVVWFRWTVGTLSFSCALVWIYHCRTFTSYKQDWCFFCENLFCQGGGTDSQQMWSVRCAFVVEPLYPSGFNELEQRLHAFLWSFIGERVPCGNWHFWFQTRVHKCGPFAPIFNENDYFSCFCFLVSVCRSVFGLCVCLLSCFYLCFVVLFLFMCLLFCMPLWLCLWGVLFGVCVFVPFYLAFCFCLVFVSLFPCLFHDSVIFCISFAHSCVLCGGGMCACRTLGDPLWVSSFFAFCKLRVCWECSGDFCPQYISEKYLIQRGGGISDKWQGMRYKSVMHADFPRNFHGRKACKSMQYKSMLYFWYFSRKKYREHGSLELLALWLLWSMAACY